MTYKKDTFWRKVKLVFACWAAFVGIGMLISIFLIIIGMDEKLDIVLKYYFTIGVVLVFVICWPIFSRYMK